MHSNAIILLFPLVATLVSAGCYSGGASGNKGTANTAVDSYACQQLSGYYVSGQKRNVCISKVGESVSWVLEIKQEGGGGTLSADECNEGIKKEINGCGNGGQSSKNGWNYRADPNNGICQDTTYQNGHPNGKAKRDGGSSEAQAGTRAPRAALMQRAPSNYTTLHFEGDTMVIYDVEIPDRVETSA